MSRTSLHRVGSLTAGVAAAGGLSWFGIDALLSGAVGLSLAVGALLLLRVRRDYPDKVTGDGWTDSRWAGVSQAVVTASALLGLLAVPVPDEYRLALGFLVVLSGFVGYVAGSLAEMERTAARESGAENRRIPTLDD
jgi:hypothetical protein